MSTAAGNPLIIEVRANEFATQQPNMAVPYGAEEMVADALASLDAGASGYHWHGRGLDGVDRPHDVELHSSVIRGIRAHSAMVLHPTLGFTSTQGDAKSRLSTIDELITRGDHPDIVPVDFGAIITDPFDSHAQRFESGDSILLNRTGYLTELLSAIGNRGIAVLAVVWSPGGIRTALRLRETGVITSTIFWQLGFAGDRVPGGLPATVKQLDAFLDELPAGEPWNVHVRDGDGLEMAVAAILRGGHVAIGLGDDPYERLGLPTNADIVAHLASVARTVGRPLATPEQARSILGLPTVAGVALAQDLSATA